MKKICCIIVVVSMLFLISACKEDKKDIPGDAYIQYGNKLIQIADQYIDYDITAEIAYKAVEELKERVSELTDAEPGTDDYFDGSAMQNLTWEIELDLLSLKTEASSERLKSLVEKRNKVAEFIGVGQRNK